MPLLPDNSLQPWTPAPHRTPALPAGHTCPERTPALAGGARGYWAGTVWRAVPGGAGSSTGSAGVRRVAACLARRVVREWVTPALPPAAICSAGGLPAYGHPPAALHPRPAQRPDP